MPAYVNGYRSEVDSESLRRTFVVDPEEKIPLGLFVRGEAYRMWGLIPMNRHLLGTLEPGAPFYLMGADRLGRDVLSRVIYGTRVSMSIGLVGVTLALILGIFLGGVSGYYGGWIDNVIQRVIEFLRSIPTIPLWMGLAAAIPLTMPPLRVYFWITVILSLIGWTGLGRVVRGRFFSLKTEDFVTAARLDGISEPVIIMKHMVPSFMSHIIASVTLAIPGMILAETSLSFLGIGLRPPVVSWGVLTARGAKHPLGRQRPLAVLAGRGGGGLGAGAQLLGGRLERRGGPLCVGERGCVEVGGTEALLLSCLLEITNQRCTREICIQICPQKHSIWSEPCRLTSSWKSTTCKPTSSQTRAW